MYIHLYPYLYVRDWFIQDFKLFDFFFFFFAYVHIYMRIYEKKNSIELFPKRLKRVYRHLTSDTTCLNTYTRYSIQYI